MRLVLLMFTVCAATQVSAQTLALDQVPPISLTSSSITSAISIDPLSGNVIARSSSGGLNQCTGAALPTITSFNSVPTSVNTGATFSLTWTSQNTTGCAPTPDTGVGTIWASLGSLPSNGQRQLTAPGSPTTLSFGLTCTGPGGSVSQTVQVVVGGSTGQCNPPAGLSVDPPTPWTAIYPNAFPSIPGGRFEWNSVLGRIYTISFVAAPASDGGMFGSIASFNQPLDGDGEFLMSISQQPGCFDTTVLGANCRSPLARYTSIGWTLVEPANFSCKLVMGQQYFLNLTFGNATAPGSGPYCASAQCTRPIASLGQRAPGS